MTNLVNMLHAERETLAKKLAGIDGAIAALNGHGAPVAGKKRKLSAEARAKDIRVNIALR